MHFLWHGVFCGSILWGIWFGVCSVAKKSVALQEAQAEKRALDKDKTKTTRDQEKVKADMDAKKHQLKSIEKKVRSLWGFFSNNKGVALNFNGYKIKRNK